MTPTKKALLIYDGDCRFCTTSARWVERHAHGSIEALPFDDPAVPPELAADHRHAHYVEGASVRHGGAAVTRALRHVRGGRVAAALDLPGVAWLRDRAYHAIARRHGPHAGHERVEGARPEAPPR